MGEWYVIIPLPCAIQRTGEVPWGYGTMWASSPTFTTECVPFNGPGRFRTIATGCVPFNVPGGSVGLRDDVGIVPYIHDGPRPIQWTGVVPYNCDEVHSREEGSRWSDASGAGGCPSREYFNMGVQNFQLKSGSL